MEISRFETIVYIVSQSIRYWNEDVYGYYKNRVRLWLYMFRFYRVGIMRANEKEDEDEDVRMSG